LFEPQSRVLLAGEIELPHGAFREALYQERLFWRNLPSSGRSRALAAHAGLVVWETLCGFPRPRLVAQWAGRALACLSVPGYLRREPAECGQNTGGKWRVDPPQPNRKLGELSKSATPNR
jgi:hypothetical protein